MYEQGKITRLILDGQRKEVAGIFSGVICRERRDLVDWFQDFGFRSPIADFSLPIGIFFEIVIKEEYRGQKLASPALNYFLKWCVGEGCSQVLLNAVDQKESAMSLSALVAWYERHGFKILGDSGLGYFMLWTNLSTEK